MARRAWRVMTFTPIRRADHPRLAEELRGGQGYVPSAGPGAQTADPFYFGSIIG